jgi:3-mercaptopyruvate sulfurtransferase SseA
LAAGAAYWKRFEGPVEQASTQINNAYLQANLQKDGVRSYGRMLDLVLAWHEAAKNAGTLDDAVVSMNLDAARSKAGG